MCCALTWTGTGVVVIWSTGFVVARLGMPHAPPMSFLAWRYGLSIVAIGAPPASVLRA